MKTWTQATVVLVLMLAGPVGWVTIDACRGLQAAEPGAEVRSFVLQGAPVADMISAVSDVGGEVLHKLPVVDAVSARLTFSQLNQIGRLDAAIRASEDGRADARARVNLQAGASDFCLTAERVTSRSAGSSPLLETRGLSSERSLSLQLGLGR
jgi:hypothetical protein